MTLHTEGNTLNEYYGIFMILKKHGVYTEELEGELLEASIESLKQARVAERTYLREKIEGMRQKPTDEMWHTHKIQKEGYNLALDDILEILDTPATQD